MDASFQIKIVTGQQMEPYISDLAALRCEVFHEYPYLYAGDPEYEKWYLENYSKQDHSVLVLALKENKVIGCSSGMPLENEKHEEFKAPFEERGYDIKSIFLYGESVLKKEYRGMGLGHIFFEKREDYVRSCGNQFKFIAFFAIERPRDHPERPKDYKDLSEFWNKKGFYKTDMTVSFPYREIGETEETNKLMCFWMKNL